MLKSLLDYLAYVAFRELQNCATSNIKGELFQLRITCPGELIRQRAGGQSEIATKTSSESFKKLRRLGTARRGEFGTNLESTPRRAIEKFAVVSSTDKNHMCWKTVNLEEQRGNNSFDLSGLVLVRSLFGDSV